MWLQQVHLATAPNPAASAPAPEASDAIPTPVAAPAPAERTLKPILISAELEGLVDLVGHESLAEASAVLKEGRPKLMAWFKEKGATLSQRQAATNAVTKAIKEAVVEKKEKKKGDEKPNEGIAASSDPHTYLFCRSKQPVRSVPNLRDVSWAHSSLRSGVLIRSGCVDFCSARDAALLVEELGVRVRIDLRLPRELPAKGKSQWFCDMQRAPRLCPNELAKRSEIQSHHLAMDGMLGDGGGIPLDAPVSELDGIEEQIVALPPPSINYMASTGLGQTSAEEHAKMYKASMYGSTASAASNALANTYVRLLEANAEAIGNALRLVSQSEGVVLLHSSAGKDRTGVVCALAMLLCDVPMDGVCRDYALSQGIKQMLYASEVADTEERVLRRLSSESPELCSSASVMLTFDAMLTRRHGSVQAWLAEHASFGPDEVSKLRERLLQPTGAPPS